MGMIDDASSWITTRSKDASDLSSMNNHEEEFWGIWAEHGDSPMAKHQTWERAKREAERLAEKCPGEKFYVLKAIAHCMKGSVVWTPLR